MCGIAGIAGSLDRDCLTSTVRAMNRAIVHRGPDDEGFWVGDQFAFGMRRLSIIDLAGGHQPMWDLPSGLGLVYNGEVYNYKAIRARLQEMGATFQTASDTEVVLKSLALKGAAAVHDWNGMFALAAWNEREKKLLLLRDRLGVKPLYFYWDGRVFLFASEIKALLASNFVPRDLNQQAIWDYLTYRYVPGRQTVWKNVWKLPPGHLLEWTPGQAPQLTRYWTTDVHSPSESFDIERKSAEFDELFLDSVSQRLLASDVPVGVMLSGGLDSSAIAAAAVELGHKRFHTFSVGFKDGGEYSELGYARQVASHLGLPNHEVVVDQREFLKVLPEAVRAMDEPLADLTIVPFLVVLRLAREHVKVALSGEGSDEVLAGYDLEQTQRKFEVIKQLQRLPPMVIKQLSAGARLLSERKADTLAQIATTPLSGLNVALRNCMTWYWDDAEKQSLWSDFHGEDSTFVLRKLYDDTNAAQPLDQFMSVMQKSWLVEDLLMKADKMSMATALELRVPFLDYRLVEWANRQPIGVKIGRFQGRTVTKHVLRRFAAKRLPAAIINRPKKGFPVPVMQWLTNDAFASWTRAHLTGRHSRVGRMYAHGEVHRQLQQATFGDESAARKIWALIVLETWLGEYEVNDAVEMGTSLAVTAG